MPGCIVLMPSARKFYQQIELLLRGILKLVDQNVSNLIIKA